MSADFGFDAVNIAELRRRGGQKWRRYGPDVLAAWVADMDFAPAPAVREALIALVDQGDLGYPYWPAGSPLREALAGRMAARYGWQIDPAQVRELCDIIQGVQLALELATKPGDAVALHTPTYPPFLSSLRAMRRRIVEIPMETNGATWRFDKERAARELGRANCRALLLVHPHNPTGKVFARDELEALAEIAERLDLLVISDEVHAELTYPGAHHVPFASLGEATQARTVTLTSATKAFNLAGIRCALAHIGPQALRERRDAAPFALYGTPSVLGVAATLAAWRDGGAWLAALVEYLAANRDHLAARLRAETALELVPPQATYLAWIDASPLQIGAEPADVALERGRVALSPGTDFGAQGRGHARLNFATSREILDAVIDAVVTALA